MFIECIIRVIVGCGQCLAVHTSTTVLPRALAPKVNIDQLTHRYDARRGVQDSLPLIFIELAALKPNPAILVILSVVGEECVGDAIHPRSKESGSLQYIVYVDRRYLTTNTISESLD